MYIFKEVDELFEDAIRKDIPSDSEMFFHVSQAKKSGQLQNYWVIDRESHSYLFWYPSHMLEDSDFYAFFYRGHIYKLVNTDAISEIYTFDEKNIDSETLREIIPLAKKAITIYKNSQNRLLGVSFDIITPTFKEE